MIKLVRNFFDAYHFSRNDFSSRYRCFSGLLILDDPLIVGEPSNVLPLMSNNFTIRLKGDELNWAGEWVGKQRYDGGMVTVIVSCEHFEFSSYDILKIHLEVKDDSGRMDRYQLGKVKVGTLKGFPALHFVGREIKRDAGASLIPRFLLGAKGETFSFVR